MLRDLGLDPFAKVTGSRGIHIIAPLKRTRTADEVRDAGGEIAERIAAERPDTLTTFWRKDKREGPDPRRRRPQHLRADDRRALRRARAARARRSRCP